MTPSILMVSIILKHPQLQNALKVMGTYVQNFLKNKRTSEYQGVKMLVFREILRMY